MSARALDRSEAEAILRSLRRARTAVTADKQEMGDDAGVGRRSYGSGSLIERGDAWYGQWRAGRRLVKRKLGPRREPGTRRGLTKAQAEAELRRAMSELRAAAPAERLAVAGAGERYIRHLETVRQRKRSTVQDYEIILRHCARVADLEVRHDAIDHVVPDPTGSVVYVAGAADPRSPERQLRKPIVGRDTRCSAVGRR